MSQEPTEPELVALAKAGDLSAFERLVEGAQRRCYRVARQITGNDSDAADATQQGFLSAVEQLHRFRGESSFVTWVSRIVSHAALKILRKRRGLPSVSLEEATEQPGGDGPVPHPEYIADWKESPEVLVERNEARVLLHSALEGLAIGYRLVFILRDVEGMSVAETAEALGISEANVKVRLMRARLQLREVLTRAFGDPQRRMPPHRHE